LQAASSAEGQPLFEAAQQPRQVRDDLDLEQVLLLLVSIAGLDGDAAFKDPMVRTVLDDLTTPSHKVESAPR
jgi:hypothetical protein